MYSVFEEGGYLEHVGEKGWSGHRRAIIAIWRLSYVHWRLFNTLGEQEYSKNR